MDQASTSPAAVVSASLPDESVLRLQLGEGAAALGIPLDESAIARFVRFAHLLHEANQRQNLTRIRPEDVATLHFLDSLALAAVHRPAPDARLLDVGTGAGFPGVPLALAYPSLHVTLLDGTQKRLAFLAEALAELGVTNAQTLHGRAEDLARDPRHRERYDLVTARAVAPMPELAGWLLPLVRPGGLAIAYKSRDVQTEIEAARPVVGANGGVIEQVAEVPLPFTDIVRKLVMLRKTRVVPRR